MTSEGPPRVAPPLVVLAWALAAVLAGAVVWWAVALIGGESGAARANVLSEARVVALVREAAPAGVPTTAAATAVPTSTSSGTPTSPPSSTTTPTPTPTPTRSSGPAPSPRPTAWSPAPASPSPTVAEVAGTWDVPGGQVAASCRGTQIALLYATPHDGWTVDVMGAGPDEITVLFRDEESQTIVRAVCRDGVPDESTHASDG